MINIFRSIALSLLGLISIGWISIILIITMFAKPGDTWLTNFVAEVLIMNEQLESFNRTFADVSDGIFQLMATMNVVLLSLTVLFSISWSAGSHYLNIDAPGKAKIYFIHWTVCTLIFVAALMGISLFFLTNTSFDNAFISGFGVTLLTAVSMIYYFLAYYVGVIVGTARFARSSVLFANKLPGGF